MLRIQDKRSIQRADPHLVRRFAQQHMQKVPCHIGIIGLRFDSFAIAMELMPIEQHGRKRCQQSICHVMLVGTGGLRLQATQSGTARPQYIHWVRVGGKLFEHSLKRRRQTSQ